MNHPDGQKSHQDGSRKRRRNRSSRGSSVAARTSVRCWLLGATTALLVVTCLVTGYIIPARESNDLLPVLCWLLIAVGWQLQCWLRGEHSGRLDKTTWAFFLMVAFHTASGLVRMEEGDGRATVSTLWQWGSYGLMFYLLRQLLRCQREVRALCVVMIAVAGFSALHGGYESFYSMPRDQAAYWLADEAGKQAMHQMAGLAPLESGTPARFHFESRLLANEPTASYALTNSLAALLAPWLILLASIGLSSLGLQASRGDAGQARSSNWRQGNMVFAVLLLTGVIGMCLVLTRSRSACIAVGLGMLLLLVNGKVRWGWQLSRRFVLQGLLLILGMIGLAFLTHRLDVTVVSEAVKSLGYRMQYWAATLDMIRDNPVFGCGPGNFQQYFAEFKLPQTSETVTDPHNFVLEIWATAGTLTLAAFGWMVWSFGSQLREGGTTEHDTVEKAEQTGVTPIYLGALLGSLVPVFFLSSHDLFLLVAYLLLILGVSKLRPWVQAGQLSPGVVLIALTVWTVNLLATGGIGIPGVALTGWLLMAIALPLPVADKEHVSPSTAKLRLAAVLCMTVGFYVTGLLPLYRSGQQLSAAATARYRAESLASQGNLQGAELAWQQARDCWIAAAEFDPSRADPWIELARFYWGRWVQSEDAMDYQQFREVAQKALVCSPRSHVLRMMIGDYYLRVSEKEPMALVDALLCYQEAHRLYPASAIIVARLACLHYLNEDRELARNLGRKSLELDRLNPHMEFKLGLRYLFEPVVVENRAQIAGVMAEEFMKYLEGELTDRPGPGKN